MPNHNWQFVGSEAPNKTPLMVAICGRCGLMRTSTIPNTLYERHFGLEGDCPGKPLPAEKRGEGARRIAA